jgi:hypothetical protein
MYNLTLCDLDGSLVACIPEAPVLPRFLHVTAGAIALADSDTPTDVDPAEHVTTFRRVASSVWVDDDRGALFVRVVTW